MYRFVTRTARAGVASLAVVGLVLAGPTPKAEATTAYDPATHALVNIVHFNDFHGRIATPLTTNFATAIEQARVTEGGDAHTLLLSGGDNIGASLYASASQQDNPTIDVLNALDVAFSASGNHEFDKGINDFQNRVKPRATFPYRTANVTWKGAPIDRGYEIFTVDGVKVAVIGAVTTDTKTMVSPAGIQNVEFTNAVDAVNRVATQLTDGDSSNGEADVLIAEYHNGSEVVDPTQSKNPQFLDIVQRTSPKICAIFGGHTHKPYTWMAPAPAGSANPTRPVIQAKEYGGQIAQLAFTVERANKKVTVAAGYPKLITPTATDLSLPRVAAVKQIVDAALAQAKIVGDQPLGSQVADITTAYRNGKRDDRSSASTMGTLIGNMLRDQAADPARGGAQIGVTNPGGLRADLLYSPDGIITNAEANAVLPFANNVWTTSLTGAQFKALLEQQWQPATASKPYLQLGLSDNVEYTYDPDRPVGERITGIFIEGKPIDFAASYRIAAPDFLLSGGDNFTVFTQGTNSKDSGLGDFEAFAAYLKAHPKLKPDFSRRQLIVNALPQSPVKVGDTVTFTVRNTDLTSLGAPVNKTLEVWFKDHKLGTFEVVGGVAQVSFVVPKPAAPKLDGTHKVSATQRSQFALRTPDSGTDIPFRLDVAASDISAEPQPPDPTPTPSQISTPTPSNSSMQPRQTQLPATGGKSPWVLGLGVFALVAAMLILRRKK